jgi:hypothetical protein
MVRLALAVFLPALVTLVASAPLAVSRRAAFVQQSYDQFQVSIQE